MSEFRPSNFAPSSGNGALFNGIRERLLLGLALVTLACGGEALASDEAVVTHLTFNPSVDYFRHWPPPSSSDAFAAPGVFSAPTLDSKQAFSATDFRPRKHTLFDSDPAVSAFGDAPLLRTTTVWQRMADYKSHDRVRVLTLWESSGSTVSLQAGRRGDPSLQWTSRLMNHGGSTQGLLDRLFSVSIAGAAAGLRNAARSTSTPATMKPVNTVPVAPNVK